MRVRAGLVLIQDDAIALIKRVKRDKPYYLIPGAAVVDGEATREAVLRKAKDALGLQVEVSRLVAVVELKQNEQNWLQLYYWVQGIGGEFGTGKEFKDKTSKAIWMPLTDIPQHKIYPKSFASVLVKGLPKATLHITETKLNSKDKKAKLALS